MSVLLLLPFVAACQETNNNILKYNSIELSSEYLTVINFGYNPIPKNYFLSSLYNNQIIDKLNNSLSKLKSEKQNLFYTKDEFSGLYNVYSTTNGEIRLQSSYFNTSDFTPTCFILGPVSNGNAGDLLGAVIHSFLSQADIKLKIGKKHTISFF